MARLEKVYLKILPLFTIYLDNQLPPIFILAEQYLTAQKKFNFKDLSNNYPTIILSNIFSNHENPNGETVHDIFELKLMYSHANTSFKDAYDNFCYITLNQADELLHKYNLQTYDELINQTLAISTNDGALLEWKIANIIIDGGDNEEEYANIN